MASTAARPDRGAGVAPRYRAVVVGCGMIGTRLTGSADDPGTYSHAQAYREHPRVDLAGVSDVDPARLADARRAWDVDGDGDALALCRRVAADIVSLCTPDVTHAVLAERLIAEAPPRLLFVEKPLALTGEDGERLLARARERGVAVAVNYSRRFSPAFQGLAAELREGRHGRPLLARFLYGKGLLHNGSHAIDLLRFWLGDPVKGTAARATGGPEGDPTYDADLWFADGCRARLDGFDERVATAFELDFLTERTRWTFALGGAAWQVFEVRDSPRLPGYRNYVPTGRAATDPLFARPMADCLGHAVENLVAFLDGTAPLLCAGEEGLAALRWVERLRAGC